MKHLGCVWHWFKKPAFLLFSLFLLLFSLFLLLFSLFLLLFTGSFALFGTISATF